jgi:hypothetical protein
MRIVRLFSSCAATALGLSCAASTWAAPALTFTPGAFTAGNNNQSVGWQFDVLAPTTVTGLGWFDDNADGLSLAHQVGIWDPSGTLLTSTTIPAGTGAPFDGQFRTVAVAPITLLPGNGYIVGGENFAASTDRIASNVTSQTLFPTLRYIDATFSPIGSGFVRPATFSAATTGFYGPSFSVPEPATAAVLLLGSIGLLMRRRQI